MKKLLLSALTLATAMMSYAQIGTEGFYYGPTGDVAPEDQDFSDGLYWWAYERDTGVPDFEYELTRTDSGMWVTLTQPKGEYKPFGISFGTKRNDTTQMNTIDISGNESYAMKIHNYSDYDVYVRVSPQDVYGNSVDLDSNASDNIGSIYLHNFERQYDNRTTASIDALEPDEVETYEGTFEGMYSSIYVDDSSNTSESTGEFCSKEATMPLDSSMVEEAISGFMITLFNAEAYGLDECYDPYAMEDATFFIEYILLGDTSTIYTDVDRDGVADDMDDCPETFEGMVDENGCSVEQGVEELKAEIGLAVAPNPASDVVVVSYIGNGSVALVNAQGATVATATGYDSSSISVANLASGFYYAVVTVGDIVVTEAIVVE